MELKALISATCLSLFLSFETVLIKLIITDNQPYPDSEQIIVLTELFKLLFSITCWYHNTNTYINVSESTQHNQSNNQSNQRNTKLFYFIFPAIVYTISNNLTYYALLEMTPALYNLLMNLKIPITAFLAYTCINYKINKILLSSFILLFFSTVLASLKFESGRLKLDTSITGIIIMLLYTTCSSGGSIIMEFITKIKYKNEDINIQNIKYAICSIMCNASIIIYKLPYKTPFVLLNKTHLILIIVSSMYGLITSYVIKHGGSILKTYATTMSIFLSSLFTYIIWKVVFLWNFYVGGILCFIAIHIFLREKRKEFIQTMRYNELVDINIENDTDTQEDYH